MHKVETNANPYPLIEPYATGMLRVDDTHVLYWEESGNPHGKPILFLHGGPGSQTYPSHRQFFHPERYRILLFDQRGAGKSTPHACLDKNTTWDLVEDIERLRRHFGVVRWAVFGGSWGSTLALCYAITYPQYVEALILRGIFLCRPQDLHWFYQAGAGVIFPEAWEQYCAPIPEHERCDMIAAFYRRLTGLDQEVRKRAAYAWSAWEAATLSLRPDSSTFARFTAQEHADAVARIECHYFVHKCFFPSDNWILEHTHRIRTIPTTIVHGRYDIPCPFQQAWDLSQALPHARLIVVPDAGHMATEPGIYAALLEATNLLSS